MEKKRIFKDYKNLTNEVSALLHNLYPEGYDETDILRVKNAKGETIKALRVETDDTIYLVKLSSELDQAIEDFDYEDNDDDNFDSPSIKGDSFKGDDDFEDDDDDDDMADQSDDDDDEDDED